MSGIATCTDSTALYATGTTDSVGVTTVPIAVALDGEPYESSDLDDFYARLEAGARATTSMPSPASSSISRSSRWSGEPMILKVLSARST